MRPIRPLKGTNMKRLLVIVSIGLLAASAATAGDLNPPAGPVAPTMKSLDKVEPRIPITYAGTSISQPGSYYLTRDLTTANANAITISASRVTLDLNGFSIVGQPGASKGIVVNGAQRDITIRNGTITNWPVRGIEASSNENCRFFDLTFAECGFDGIMAGSHALISNCVSRDNGEDGIHAGTYSVVTNCTTSGNGGCGFKLDGNAVITGCTATANVLNGIAAYAGTRVSDCVVSSNTLSGISATGRCLITGNNCAGNGLNGTGAGIILVGGDNRVDGNNLTINDFGVQATAAGNLIIRNSASGNTSGNYSIVAGNTVGPVVNEASIAASTNPHANYSY